MVAHAKSKMTHVTEPKEELEDFCLPWCKRLAADPSFSSIPMISRNRKNPFKKEGSFMADTLWTSNTIRASQAFYRSPASSSSPSEMAASSDSIFLTDESRRVEVRMLFSLGSGMNGHSNIAHGGMVMVMLDEAMGYLAALQNKRWIMTAELIVKFKKPVPTPSVVLCRAWLLKPLAGRKIWVEGTVEDGNGGVYAVGNSLNVEVRAMEKL